MASNQTPYFASDKAKITPPVKTRQVVEKNTFSDVLLMCTFAHQRTATHLKKCLNHKNLVPCRA